MKVGIQEGKVIKGKMTWIKLFWISIKNGRAVALSLQDTPDAAMGFQDELNARGIIGLRGKQFYPSDKGFLKNLQYEFKSPYFLAGKPEKD